MKIHPDFQNFFKFSYKGTLYKYTALPNDLCTCPRKFTKMMKPVTLSFFEPILMINTCKAKPKQKCIANVIAAITFFENLRLVIHPEKSVIVPQQRPVFLSFITDSILMTVSLTQDKITKIKTLLSSLLDNSCSAKYGALYYRNLEMNKVAALKLAKGNFEETKCISHNGISELNWWLCNVDSSFNTIQFAPLLM